MDTEFILRLKHITKEYPGVIALDDFSIDVYPGEVHAIVGENGAGKSTLIKTITGAIQPTKGTIIYDGEEIEHQDPIVSRNAGISCIYQEFNLFPYLTITENVFFGKEILKNGFLHYESMNKKTEAILEDLGICVDPTTLVKDLTVGFQQIVEIAKSLSDNVRVLIMDEPSAPLTNNELHYLFEIVKKLRSQGVAIIYISHRLEEVFELSDRVTVLRDGEFIHTCLTNEIDRNGLIKLMVGRSLGQEFPWHARSVGSTTLAVSNLSTDKLADVSFTVREGEIVGLAGLVGAGRTELARAIFGADPISEGTIELSGEEVSIENPARAVRLGIGLIPEDRKQHGILGLLTIRENISFASIRNFLAGFFINRKKENAAAEEMKQSLRIKTPTLEAPLLSLSGGNQQKVVLAKTLLTGSKVIFFDEPTRGIDVGAKQEIYKLMLSLAEEGKAIVMISSEMPELLGMSDRILVMSEGRIIKELPREEFDQETILHYASIVDEEAAGC